MNFKEWQKRLLLIHTLFMNFKVLTRISIIVIKFIVIKENAYM